MTKEEISKLLYERICYGYCNNCRFRNERINNEVCEDCNRKMIKWGISKKCCDEIAKKIVKGSADNE